jgi:N-acetylglucosamine kinase-like BadF-type ATPase
LPAIQKLFFGTPASGIHLSNDALLLASTNSASHGVALIAGTGSVAVSWKRGIDGLPERAARRGGWGSLLGDEGSAFGIGRAAIRLALEDDERESNLCRAVKAQFADKGLSMLQANKLVIADTSRIVFELEGRGDEEARALMTEGAVELAKLVRPLWQQGAALTMGGSLLTKSGRYRNVVVEQLSNLVNIKTEVVENAAEAGIRWMCHFRDDKML